MKISGETGAKAITRATIREISVPPDSEIAGQLAGADFYDCYELPLNDAVNNMHPEGGTAEKLTAMQIYLNVFKTMPAWVDALMLLRNRLVMLVGLKHLGRLRMPRSPKAASAYRVGDRVGIFSLLYVSEQEIIVGDSDKHLDVKISLRRQDAGGQSTVAMSTVVHIHNRLGQVYMFFVTPMHKIIARAVLNRQLKRG